MYGMVLMAAMTAPADATSFGKGGGLFGGGCNGAVAGCSGMVVEPRHGLLERLKKKKHHGECPTPCPCPPADGGAGPVDGGGAAAEAPTPEEMAWFEEMVKAKAYEAKDIEDWKKASHADRKTAYDTFKKAAAPTVPAPTDTEMKWFKEMVDAKAYEAKDIEDWKKATPAERKKAYETFKKAKP